MTYARKYRKMPYLVMLRIGKVILDPDAESDQHHNLTTSRRSSLANAYQFWWMSDNWTS